MWVLRKEKSNKERLMRTTQSFAGDEMRGILLREVVVMFLLALSSDTLRVSAWSRDCSGESLVSGECGQEQLDDNALVTNVPDGASLTKTIEDLPSRHLQSDVVDLLRIDTTSDVTLTNFSIAPPNVTWCCEGVASVQNSSFEINETVVHSEDGTVAEPARGREDPSSGRASLADSDGISSKEGKNSSTTDSFSIKQAISGSNNGSHVPSDGGRSETASHSMAPQTEDRMVEQKVSRTNLSSDGSRTGSGISAVEVLSRNTKPPEIGPSPAGNSAIDNSGEESSRAQILSRNTQASPLKNSVVQSIGTSEMSSGDEAGVDERDASKVDRWRAGDAIGPARSQPSWELVVRDLGSKSRAPSVSQETSQETSTAAHEKLSSTEGLIRGSSPSENRRLSKNVDPTALAAPSDEHNSQQQPFDLVLQKLPRETRVPPTGPSPAHNLVLDAGHGSKSGRQKRSGEASIHSTNEEIAHSPPSSSNNSPSTVGKISLPISSMPKETHPSPPGATPAGNKIVDEMPEFEKTSIIILERGCQACSSEESRREVTTTQQDNSSNVTNLTPVSDRVGQDVFGNLTGDNRIQALGENLEQIKVANHTSTTGDLVGCEPVDLDSYSGFGLQSLDSKVSVSNHNSLAERVVSETQESLESAVAESPGNQTVHTKPS